MTKNESFKKRVRARMAETGEKYGAARRHLIAQSNREDGGWVSEPETAEASVRDNTGRGYDEWRELIEAWPGHADGHTAVAAWLQEEHSVDGWWAQAVTVGWERITGRRLPGQMADGTFTANKSRTLTTDAAVLRESLIEADGRDALFPGMDVTLRSKPTSKNLRLGVGDGVVEVAITPKDDGRATVVIAHAKLGSPDDVEHWKAFWTDWLAALDDA